MKANYHTHTARCGHAMGSDAEYAAEAYKAGIKILGFSDHTPYVGFDGDYYSTYRMRPEQMADYANSINSLKEEYRGKMDILLGLEAEYYPRLFDGLMEFLRPYNVDYLILGQHFIDDDQYGQWVNRAKTDEELKKYVDQCCEALDTGLFSYIAHPDIVGYDRNGAAFESEMRRLCRHAKALDIPLEINLLGLSTGRHYPCREFWRIAGEEGCKAVLGRDAHLLHAFWEDESEAAAIELAKEFSVEITEDIDTSRLKKA